VPVLTKADKLSKTKQKKQLQAIARILDISEQELILFSAKSRLGKEALWRRMAQHADFINNNK
jgi:GTP-binding protein